MSAPTHLVMPKLGLTMEEGKIARWAVQPGARFASGDIIVVVETDKIANDVEAPAAGELVEVLAPEGAVVPVSAPIARWRLHGRSETAAASATPRRLPLLERGQSDAPLGDGASLAHHLLSPENAALGIGTGQRLLSTPYARRLAREAGIDISRVAGSGPRGRIKAADVARHLAAIPTGSSREITAAGSIPLVARAPAAQVLGSGARDEARILSMAQIDIDTRGLREIARSLGGNAVRLAIVVMACTRALEVTAPGSIGLEVSADGAPPHLHLDIGVRESLRAVTAAIADAKAGKGGAAATGGSLLVAQGSDHAHLFAPAAPAGWSAILGIGAERDLLKRAADGAIAEAFAMTLALSYDAARISNAAALAFLSTLKQLLEEPLAMLAG